MSYWLLVFGRCGVTEVLGGVMSCEVCDDQGKQFAKACRNPAGNQKTCHSAPCAAQHARLWCMPLQASQGQRSVWQRSALLCLTRYVPVSC